MGSGAEVDIIGCRFVGRKMTFWCLTVLDEASVR